MSKVAWTKPVYHLSLSDNSSGYDQTLRKNDLQLTKLQILYQQHYKVSRYSGSFICNNTRPTVDNFHMCSTFLQFDYLQTTTAFNKPLIFYQFQSNIQPIINQASDLLSILEHYPAQHSTSI